MARLTHAGKEGPAGPPGPKGETGEKGAKGADAKGFEFVQSTPAATWHIVHNLKKRPAVLVQDSANSEVEGDIEFLNTEELNLHFSAPFSGEAYLS